MSAPKPSESIQQALAFSNRSGASDMMDSGGAPQQPLAAEALEPPPDQQPNRRRREQVPKPMRAEWNAGAQVDGATVECDGKQRPRGDDSVPQTVAGPYREDDQGCQNREPQQTVTGVDCSRAGEDLRDREA